MDDDIGLRQSGRMRLLDTEEDERRQRRNQNEVERIYEEEDETSSLVALKIVLVLATVLVCIDIMEIYYTYLEITEAAGRLNRIFFENCVKYHLLSQIAFTFFATLAGISTCLMSFGVLFNHNFFLYKALDSYLYLNYMIFGPYLLSFCMLSFAYFDNVGYECIKIGAGQMTKKVNFSMMITLSMCLIISLVITLGVSIGEALSKLISSLRFNSNGSYYLGRLFWWSVLNLNSSEHITRVSTHED